MLLFPQLSNMRFFLLLFSFSVCLLATDSYFRSYIGYPSTSPLKIPKQGSEEFIETNKKAKIDIASTASYYVQTVVLTLNSLPTFFIVWLQFTRQTNFVTFKTNLNLLKKKNYTYNSNLCTWFLSINITVLLLIYSK